jgi:hypothetical protein
VDPVPDPLLLMKSGSQELGPLDHRGRQRLMTKFRGISPQANYTDRATAACRRSLCQLFADRGCRVVTATDPHGRPGPLLFHSSRFLFIPTRLSGPRSRRSTSHKIWYRPARTWDLWICSSEYIPLYKHHYEDLKFEVTLPELPVVIICWMFPFRHYPLLKHIGMWMCSWARQSWYLSLNDSSFCRMQYQLRTGADSVPQTFCQENERGSGGIVLLRLNDTRWIWVVSFTFRPLYRRRNSPLLFIG